MFGGLEIKGNADKKEEKEGAPAQPPSGFSFLSSTTPLDPDPEPEPEPAKPSSGFSFLSSTTQNETKSSANQSDEKNEEDEDSAPTSTSSGFSFLSASAANPIETTAEKVEEEKEEANTAEKAATTPSGFGFLSSNVVSDTTTTAVDSSEGKKDDAASAVPESQSVGISSTNESMFSMLNLKSADTPKPVPAMSMAKATAPAMKPPLPSSADDILSLANPSQLTGSGIVFGGAAKPKVVKKRVRGKKIGAKATNMASAAPVTPVTMSIPAPVPVPSQPDEPPVLASETRDTIGNESSEKRQFTDDANQAASRAEEFISSRQPNSNSSYTGRYSGKSSIVEDYGDSGAGASASAGAKDDETSEDYERAKAAAQEAMKSSSATRKMGFGGGFGGFFKRSLSNSSPASSITGEKEKTPFEKTLMKIPVYGERKASDDSSYESDGGSDDDNRERESKLTIQREREREREHEREIAKQDEERLRRQEQGMLRLKAEKEAMENQYAEKQRLEEEHRAQLEQNRTNEDRRKKEKEEAAKRTPAQLLQNLLDDFAEKSQSAILAVGTLRQERSAMLEKRTMAEKQERLSTQQIAQAEKQQMEAAEQEDFELADQLAAVIEQHKAEQEERAQILKKIESLVEDLDDEKIDVGKRVWTCFITVQKDLQQFLDLQKKSDLTDSSDLWKKFETVTKSLAAENERLSADLKNIERDEGFVKEERTELEAKISEETSGIENSRDVANGKLKVINDEIEELRRQLEAKEMEAAQVKMELHDHEASIEQVRRKFSRQLTRLNKKESAAEESRKEWDAEEATYKKRRGGHEAEVTAHSEALVAHDNIIANVKSQIDLAEDLAKIIVQKIVVEKSADPEKSDEELLLIQANVLTLEAATDEAKQVLAAAKKSIDTLKEELGIIDTRLPILEAEKKLAASKRDFKAAAKASKEIKSMLARKESCADDLEGDAQNRLKASQEEVEICLEALEKKKLIAHEKEKKGGVKQMARLAERIINLEKLRESVCGTDEEEHQSVKSVGGFVLDSEISALMMEGDELDKKYGGWTDIMLEYANNTETDEADAIFKELDEEILATDENPNEDHCEEDNSGCLQSDEIPTNENAVEDSTESKAELAMRYKEIMIELKDLDGRLEIAIEAEDYEEAAEIDDRIATLKNDSDSLGMTDEEKEAVMSINEGDNSCTNEDIVDKTEIENNDIEDQDFVDEKEKHDVDNEDPAKENTDSLQESHSDSGCTDEEVEGTVSINVDDDANGDNSMKGSVLEGVEEVLKDTFTPERVEI